MTERWKDPTLAQVGLSAAAVRRAFELSPYPKAPPPDVEHLVVEVGDYSSVGVPDDRKTTIVLTALLEALDTGSRRVPSEVTEGRRAHGLATLLANTLGDGAEVLTPLPPRWTEEQMRVPGTP